MKYLKNILFIMMALCTMTMSPSKSKNLSNYLIENNFVEWSNSVSKEEAKSQLKEFLTSFDSFENAQGWLISKGFVVEKPRLMNENEAKILGIFQSPTFSLVSNWDVKKNGVIFSQNFLSRLEAISFVYGVTIEILYTENFNIHKVIISKTRL